ncbi:MAG: hypothetical protein WCJ26_13915 [bacterium]
MKNISTLVIHPDDRSTDFLKGLYKDLPNKTVITGGITKYQLQEYIETHARVILCGHGSPNGLFSVGQFSEGPYIIGASMVQSLRNKANSLLIWCNSDVFVRRHGLTGFHTGMFLSQMSECLYFNVNCSEEQIVESNNEFAKIVSKHIEEPPIVLYKNVLVEYGRLVQTNPVARYNHSRLYLNRFEPVMFADKVCQSS